MTDLGLKISYGLSSTLPSKANGNIYVCIDNKKVYADLPNASDKTQIERIELGDISGLAKDISKLNTELSNLSSKLQAISYSDLINLPYISNKDYTGGATWYFPLGKMAIDDSGNFGNFTFTGRFGGWTNGNTATYSIMLMNRSDYSGDNITSTVSASGAVSEALSLCDIVVAKNSDKSHTVYLKCKDYFVFDFAYTTFQHEIIYNGTYTTTAPSDIKWTLSGASKTILSSTGVFTTTGGVPASNVTGLNKVATSGNYNDLSNKPNIPTAASKGYNGYLSSGSDGVTEVGQYFDFHVKDSNGNLSDNDYDTRLKATGQSKNTLTLPTSTGTLVVGDKEYIIKVSKSAPAAGTADNVITFVVGE